MQEKRIKKIIKTIELLKYELKQLADESEDLTDKELLEKSRELDSLLTEYYRLIKQENGKTR